MLCHFSTICLNKLDKIVDVNPKEQQCNLIIAIMRFMTFFNIKQIVEPKFKFKGIRVRMTKKSEENSVEAR